MKSFRSILLGIGLFLTAAQAIAQPLQRPVPFKLPARDTSFSQFLPASSDAPAGKHGALGLDTNGHIVAADGTRLRFFGTELDYTANFLTSQDARTLALRLQKLGFNAVRLVEDDYYGWDDASLFRVYDSLGMINYSSYKINWPQFARMDTLLHEFKEAGIYTFLTLSSTHQFGVLDSIPGIDSINSYYYFFARFTEPRAAQLEREWARTFLTHFNPLTGLTYANDPSIAVAEITWQNSLYEYWQYNRLNYIDSNNVAPKGTYTISYFQSRQFDSLYATYLKNKYHTDAALNFAWQGNPNPSQANLMENGSFEDPVSNAWSFQAAPIVKASIVDADGGVDSTTYKKIRILDIGSNPAYGNISFQNTSPVTICGKDSLYELSFWAKMPYSTSRPTQLTKSLYLYIDNYIGGYPANAGTYITIDTGWKQYKYKFRAIQPGVQTIVLYMGESLGDVWLDAFSLHHTAEEGLLPGESINTSTVVRLTTSNVGAFPFNRVRDQTMFMDSLQISYYASIARLIKDTLHFKGLVNYSQANYWGLTPDQYMNSFGDVTEGVVGWDYITNRTGTTWSDSTWMMSNTAETKNTNGGNMGYYLPSNSVAGKAFIATIGSPSINQSNAEHMLLLPAYAAYQDWDGIFFEMYATDTTEVFADHILDYFANQSYHYYALSANSALLALAPVASNLFRNGYVTSAPLYQQVQHDPDDVWLAPLIESNRGPWGVDGYLDPNIFTALKVRQKFDAPQHRVAAQYAYVGDTAVKQSPTGELMWDQTDGLFTINASRVNGAAGLFGIDTFALSGIQFNRLDNTRDMFTLYYETEDGLSLDSSQHSFLTISPRVQNSGLSWVDSVGFGKNWGTAPMLMNAQRLSISIKSAFDSVLIFPLDSMGQLMQIRTGDAYSTAEIVATKDVSPGWFRAAIDQTLYPSVWYYVVKKNSTNAVAAARTSEFAITLSPNPASSLSTLQLSSSSEERVSIIVVDDLGRIVQTVAKNQAVLGVKSFEIATSSLAAGHYIVQVTGSNKALTSSLNVVR